MMLSRSLCVALIALFTQSVFLSAAIGREHVHQEHADGGMVVSDSAIASRVGRDILIAGGNAVDAAVATAFALAVTWPEAGNIGGGGFMVIRPTNGDPPVCVDYRETAPLAAAVDTFRHGESLHTRKIVGVPGTVRGLEAAHQKYGRLSWAEVVNPAVNLARDGFTVDASLARSMNSVLRAVAGKSDFHELRRCYGKNDESEWAAGDQLTLADLSKTLALIAEDGADAFYSGPIADLLLKEMEKPAGLIRREDLLRYEARLRKPVIGTFHGYTIIGAPPPSSGGTAMVQGLNMVEAIDLSTEKHSPQTMHLMAEISRRFFLDRARHLGDPDSVAIPDHLTSKEYARDLVADIDPNHATDSAELADDIPLIGESEDTTHFSVVDGDGMAVSNTYTLERSWGCRIVVPGAGFVLNNEMGDFNWVKGHTDRIGRIGTDANLLQPGKRMLSSQCPVIVAKDDRVVLVTGSPGGRTILNTVFNVVLNILHFKMPVTQAVAENRYHHQWMPDVLYLERVDDDPFQSIRGALERRGHKVMNRSNQGSAHTIWLDENSQTLIGVSDSRRGGRPAGISSTTISRWNFGGSKGGTLQDQVPVGESRLQWSDGIAGCSLDGDDTLVVRRDAPNMPDRSFVRLPEGRLQISATMEVEGLRFGGESKNEKLQFAFTQNDRTKPLIVASMTLGRNERDEVVVYGEALGDGASAVSPVVVSPTRELTEPISIRLTADLKGGNYRIGVRRPAETSFQDVGTGKLSRGRTINFGRLRAINDFSASGEYVRIDAIELSAQSDD